MTHLKYIGAGLGLLLAAVSFNVAATGLQAAVSVAAAASSPGKGNRQVIALIAAVGDQLTVVRQKTSTGSHLEPFTRNTLHTNSQALNFAALRGLDKALAKEEPQSQRVLLTWVAPEALSEALAKASKSQRGDLLLDAVREQLRADPERSQWDRIEVIVPHYSFLERGGMGSKLDGVGIYIQPLQNQSVSLNGTGDISTTDADGDLTTVDPTTGNKGKESTYVAPYCYFDRVTLDAHTLAVIARKSEFDNTKYNDPMSAAIDVGQQLSPDELLARLSTLVERSAYQSVRGKNEVLVGPVIALPAALAASASRQDRP